MPKRWSEDDEIYLEYLLFSGDEISYQASSAFLNKSVNGITKKAWRMRKANAEVGYMRKDYTEAEDEYIKGAYSMTSLKDMSEMLNRPAASICRRMSEMGLHKNKRLKDYDRQIRALASKGHYQSEISRMLGLNVKSVHSYMKKHEIDYERAPKEVMQKRFRELDKLSYLQMQERRARHVKTKRDQ